MMESFLKNEAYQKTIAKLAIAVQLFFTVAISLSFFSLIGKRPTIILLDLLLCNALFVCVHIAYRISYRGPKIRLVPTHKKILSWHVALSLLALIFSFVLAFGKAVSPLSGFAAIILWIFSLIFGLLFFFGKYAKFDRMENR